jgi:RHS repeat-associated protein
MDVVEVNRHLKPGKSRFGRHSRKRKTPRSWGGFADGKAQNFFWDGLALIRRGETNLTNEPYVTGGNPIIANDTTLFNDILGTTQGATDGKEFSQISRDSFGQTLDNSTDTNYDYFTGKPKIEGLGYAFLFRNYAAGLGKWTTSDPLGYPDGWNNFAYVNNRVTRCFDWLGGYIQVADKVIKTAVTGYGGIFGGDDSDATDWVAVGSPVQSPGGNLMQLYERQMKYYRSQYNGTQYDYYSQWRHQGTKLIKVLLHFLPWNTRTLLQSSCNPA